MIHIYFLVAEAFVVLGYLLGAAFFPKRFPLLFYKFFGVVIFSLVLWYTTIFSGQTWIALFPTVLGGLCVVGIALIIAFRHRITFPSRNEVLKFIGIEIISYLLFLVWAYVRTYKPDILGTEKLMDVALINAILKQGVLPIENPWLSGFLMNYYYFGHFLLAVLQYIARVPTEIGYNLAISLLGVWILQSGFLVARKLRLHDLSALLISGIMTFGGNLYLATQSFVNVAKSLGEGWGSFVYSISRSFSTVPWFASATRVIPYTINEYPSYSVILGDLHGHYLSYAFFLIGIFIILDLFFPEEKVENESYVPRSVFLGLLLGVLYLTNSWDVLTLGVLALGSATIIGWKYFERDPELIIPWVRQVILFMGIPVVLASLPQFWISRSFYLPPVGGIGVNTMFSSLFDLYQLFGQYVIIAAMGGFMVWHAITKSKFLKTWKNSKVVLPLLFLIVGFLLVLAVEFFYAKDVFSFLNPPYSRTNTVFKIYYHAWVFLCFGSISLFFVTLPDYLARASQFRWMYVFEAIFILVISIVMSFPFTSVEQYLMPKGSTFSWRRLESPSWSNGYSYIRDQHSPDDEIIKFFDDKPVATILESVTYDSYSYYARISAYTGMSAVTGWPLHNVQWYNGYDGEGLLTESRELKPMLVADRVVDIEKMYTSTNQDEVQKLLQKYNVTYVIFGAQEKVYVKSKTSEGNRSIYNSICDIAWEKDDAAIYQCRK